MRKLTVLDYLDESVRHFSEKCAVICEDERISYKELQESSMVIATSIISRIGNVRQKPILLFMDKSIPCVVSIYAILRTGNIYVPADIKTPLERIEKILEVMGSDIIISTEKEATILRNIGYQGEILIYEELLDQDALCSETKRLHDIRITIMDSELMYLLFTSGSTGIPKAVAVMHRSVVDYIDAFLDDSGMCDTDIVGNQAPFYADMSLKDFMSLYVGGTLVIIPQRYFMTPKKLLGYIDENKVTMIMWVPTAYRLVSQFDGLSKIRPSELRKFVFSGETMPIPVFRYWTGYYHIAECEYIQLYGPTEITGACTSYHIAEEYEDGETIPIGKAFRNTGILLLDEDGNVIKDVGTPGEICVYGTCLAAGYYNNEEKTRDCFWQNPMISGYSSLMYKTGDIAKYDKNCNLIFISRKDYQIKHGGKRIELGEIEAAGQSSGLVKACCCVHLPEEDVIAMLYTGESELQDIKKCLAESVPKYMIPTKYIKLEELPMLPNGKLDRKQMQRIAMQK
jgi:amino acid adenylation domain-containing protein